MSASDSPQHEYRTGDRIASKYVLERVLGTGGMGAVWVAHDTVLDVRVAMKLIRPELAADETAHRFLGEARAEARLSHPAIVHAFDFGTTEHGAPFIVMDLLEGRSLGDLLRRCEQISPVMAIQVLLPVLDALAHAHERGIVHRDLTPENIFLSRFQRHIQPKIVDFGIALLSARPVRRITENGTIVGCPRYMSPEQARGEEDVDHRSDLWTVCVVLYEALTGCSPFDAENYNAALRAVIERDVMPLTELDVGDPALWRIVEKGLSRPRDERWQSARELGTALARWLLGQGVTTDIAGAPLEDEWFSVRSPSGMGDVLDDILARETASIAPCVRSSRTSELQAVRAVGSALRVLSATRETARAILARAETLPARAAILGGGALLLTALGVAQQRQATDGGEPSGLERSALSAPAAALHPVVPVQPSVVADATTADDASEASPASPGVTRRSGLVAARSAPIPGGAIVPRRGNSPPALAVPSTAPRAKVLLRDRSGRP